MQLTVNTGFESLIPPLREEELAGLEQSILTDGCRDPLVIWNNTIIDGHHRYAICTKHSIPFNTTFSLFSLELLEPISKSQPSFGW